jgi:hypothetical protein
MVFVLPLASLQAQSRAQKPNDFTIELGGRCILYTLCYQRMLGETFGLEVGASYWGGGKSDFILPQSLLFLSGGARLYLSKKNTAPTLSAGIVYVTAGWNSGSFTVHGHGVCFYATPGFEYRALGGFVFRGGVNFLIANRVKIMPGIALGIAF